MHSSFPDTLAERIAFQYIKTSMRVNLKVSGFFMPMNQELA